MRGQRRACRGIILPSRHVLRRLAESDAGELVADALDRERGPLRPWSWVNPEGTLTPDWDLSALTITEERKL